jgi:PD-(D/E)XK nuclease superfamily
MCPSKPNKRENRSGARWYDIDGIEYPSVTTILQVIGKPALIAWSAKVERELVTSVSCQLYQDLAGTPRMSPEAYLMSLATRLGKEKANQRELQKAGDIGSQAHKLIEWNLRASLMQDAGPSPHVTDKATWAFMAWEDWKKSVNLKPIWIEQTVWSKRYGYAGTMDLLAEVNGKLTVVDWKTGKAIYPEAYLQNAAYRHALREMGHGDPVQGIIVRLPKNTEDPEFEAQIVPEHEDSLFHTFLHTFELWKWAQKGEEEYQAKRNAAEAAKIDQQICAQVGAMEGK